MATTLWATICAMYNAAFGLFHLTFWRLLRWRTELPLLKPTNAAVVQTLNICLTWLFFVNAWLYFRFPTELAGTSLGRAVALGMLLFWVIRTVLQVVFFNMRDRVHQGLLAAFVVGVVLHAGVVWP